MFFPNGNHHHHNNNNYNNNNNNNNNLCLKLKVVNSFGLIMIRPCDPLLMSLTLCPMNKIAFYCWIINLRYLNMTLTTQNL
jgi:hypothetical protein